MKSGTINLASVRTITGVTPSDGRFSVQLLSADLSADTTVYLDLSLDGTNWGVAQESGADVSDTIVAATTKVISYSVDQGVYFRVRLDGATTGSVAYLTNGL